MNTRNIQLSDHTQCNSQHYNNKSSAWMDNVIVTHLSRSNMDIFNFSSGFHTLRNMQIHFVSIKISVVWRGTTITNKYHVIIHVLSIDQIH